MNLMSLLDRFLARSLLQTADEKILFKSRVLAAITVMYLSSMTSMAAIFFVLSYLKVIVIWPAVISCAGSASCYLCQVIYFRKTGNQPVAAATTMVIMLFFTATFTCLTGGWTSPLTVFLFVAPMYAFLVSGYRLGMACSSLTVMVYLALYLLQYYDVAMPHLIAQRYEQLFIFFTWVYSWAMIVGGVILYSMMVNNLNTSLNSEKERLRQKAVYDDETALYTRRAFNQLVAQKAQLRTTPEKSFALVFMELVPGKDGLQTPAAGLVKKTARALEKQFGKQVIVSRYSNLALTALVASVDTEEQLQENLARAYQDMSNVASDQDATLLFGAASTTTLFNNTRLLVDEARIALFTAKAQERPFVSYSMSDRKAREPDYLSRVVVTTYSNLKTRPA